MSTRSVLSVLDAQRYEILPIGITEQGTWVTSSVGGLEGAWALLDALRQHETGSLRRVALLPDTGDNHLYAIEQMGSDQHITSLGSLDVIFPLLHGTFGEDGTVQGLLELADVAYVGANVLSSAVGMDKAVFKDIMRSNGLPVVDSITLTRREIEQGGPALIERIEAAIPYPIFTKPANLGSSVGITKCRNRSDLFEGLLEAAAYDRRVLAERGIPGAREIEVSVLGNEDAQVSIPGEIAPFGDFYTYDAKYVDDRSTLIIPARLPDGLTERAQQLALLAFRAIDGCGMARVDFLLDPRSEELYVGELNTIPGFTQISMYPKLWQASGLPYAGLIDRLIVLAFERKADRDRTERHFRRKV